jgi:hypothetical protein
VTTDGKPNRFFVVEIPLKPPTDHPYDSFEIRNGMFARRAVTKGSLIISDPCLLTIKESNFINNVSLRTQHIIFSLQGLPEADQDYIASLHPPSGGLSAVCSANSFAVEDGQLTRRLYNTISKIKHSCRPNAVLRDGEEGKSGLLMCIS